MSEPSAMPLMDLEVRTRKWLQCAEIQKNDVLYDGDSGEGLCGAIWDGLLCWNRSQPGVHAQPCPEYVEGFSTQAQALKICTENGSWYRNEFGLPWTNYTACDSPPAPSFDDFELLERWMPVVKKMTQVGYSVSLIVLVVALCVLSSIRRLRCPRISLHKHLFASFLLRACITLLKDALFVRGLGLPADVEVTADGSVFFNKGTRNWQCKLITSLWHYFIMANFSWILMEGLYLHNLIFLALFSDSSAICLYIILGWGAPVVFVGAWAMARAAFEDDFCWTTSRTRLWLLIRIPIVLSVLTNFALFVNIVRVLLTKLQCSSHLERRRARYRRFARSTLVLVPLYGVHYTLFLGMSLGEGRFPRLELAWIFCDQFFASFQGLFVSLLYCLLNAEVRAELVRKWALWRGRRCRGGSMGVGLCGLGGGGPEGAGPRRSIRGSSLTSVLSTALSADTLARMAELGRSHGRIRTVSGSEDDRVRCAAA